MSRKGGTASAAGDSDEISQVFFTNLRLLGFDDRAMSAQHHTVFSSGMFDLPNRKGYEVVMHFLFSRLNLTMCREQFRHCWPIYGKKEEQDFNKTVRRWLTDIAKEEPDSNLPRTVPSLFLSPGGEKFKTLLFYFSTFVLKRCITQELGVKDYEILKRPTLTASTSKLGGAMHKVLVCNQIRHRKRFFTVMQESILARKHWKEYSSELVREYRKQSKMVRDLDRQLREARQEAADRAAARGSPNLPEKAMAVKRAQLVQEVRAMWKELERFSHEQSAEKEVVESILQSVRNKYQIDGRAIHVNVPELLLRECEQEILRRRVENTYEGGKLNLLSLVQLWNLSMHLYIEKLREVGVPELDVTPISTLVHTHQTYLSNAEALSNELSEDVLPKLKASVSELLSKLPEEIPEYPLPNADSVTKQVNALQLASPTQMEICMTPDHTLKTPPELRLKMSPRPILKTPDAVEQLKKSVEKASRKAHAAEKVHVPVPRVKHKGEATEEFLHKRETTADIRVRSRLPTRQTTKPSNSSRLGKGVDKGRGRPAPGERSSPEGERPADGGGGGSPETLENGDHDNSSTGRRVGRKLVNRQTSAVSRNVSRNNKPSLSALDILAEKVANAVVYTDSTDSAENSPMLDYNLENPTAAVDGEAFVSRDRIPRSPLAASPFHTPSRPAPTGITSGLPSTEPGRFDLQEDDLVVSFEPDTQRGAGRVPSPEADLLRHGYGYHDTDTSPLTSKDTRSPSPHRLDVGAGSSPVLEVFSADSLSSARTTTARTPINQSPSRAPVTPRDFVSGDGDFGDEEAFAPVEQGLQFTSPFRSKPPEEKKSSSIDDLIANYKKVRSSVLNSVVSNLSNIAPSRPSPVQKRTMEGVKTREDILLSPLSSSEQLFSLDIEDTHLDLVESDYSETSNKENRIHSGFSPVDQQDPVNVEQMFSLVTDDLIDLPELSGSKTSAIKGDKLQADHIGLSPWLRTPSNTGDDRSPVLKELFSLDFDADLEDKLKTSPGKKSPLTSTKKEQRVRFSPQSSHDSYGRQAESSKHKFTLDVEDIDDQLIWPSENSPYGGLDGSALDSFLGEEGSFLVPASPTSPV